MIVDKNKMFKVLQANDGSTAKELVKPAQNLFGSNSLNRTDVNGTLYAMEKTGLVIRHVQPTGAPTWTVNPNPPAQPETTSTPAAPVSLQPA